MKKILRNRLFMFLLGVLVFGSISIYAASKYSASNVEYTLSDGKVMTVQDTLNELYPIISEGDAKSGDIINGKKAVVKGKLVTGSLQLDASKIAKGETIAGIVGTYTSDATATASDIKEGKTAYVNGEKIVGSSNSVELTPLTLTGSYSISGSARSGGWSRSMSISNSGTILSISLPMYTTLTVNSKSNCNVTFTNGVLTITASASASVSQSDVADGSISTSKSISYNITLS